MSRSLAVPFVLASLAGPLLAQGGGFVAENLFLLSPAVQGPGATDGALMRIDLSTNTASMLLDTFTTQSLQGNAAFDPYRQRIVCYAGLHSAVDPPHMWATNAAGNLDDLGLVGGAYAALAPVGDGRIYMSDQGATGSSNPFVYLDASGALLTLMDAAGTQPFKVDGNGSFEVRGMIYVAITNALYIASTGTGACLGGALDRVNVHKLPLSVDGKRVVGPVTCAQFEVSSSGEVPSGWSRGPSGQLVLVVDTGSDAKEQRMLLVDPVTLAFTPFASNGIYTGASATNAGTWTSALGKVIVLDTLLNGLRAFAPGESGAGVKVPIVGTLSGSGSGEVATLFEIPFSDCTGGWTSYGTGLAGKGGVLPRLTGGGCLKIGGNFTLTVDAGVGGATGMLFVGLSPASQPFKGGTFLVGSILFKAALFLGGAPGVAGKGSLMLPAALPGDPSLIGLTVYLQAGLHDVAAIKDVALTRGLRLEIG